jgi:glyoxylate utilization-related uncharacterized protein
MTNCSKGHRQPDSTLLTPPPPMAGLEHRLWLLEGTLVLTLDTTAYTLAVGDCQRWRLFGATRFDCPGPAAARYILSIGRP